VVIIEYRPPILLKFEKKPVKQELNTNGLKTRRLKFVQMIYLGKRSHALKGHDFK